MPKRWHKRSQAARIRQAQEYVEAASDVADTKRSAADAKFDVVFIDGRFRVACALHALRLSHDRTSVLVHDAVEGARMPLAGVTRHYLNGTKNFYDVVQQASRLVWLRPKPGAIDAAVHATPWFREAYSRALDDVARR